MIILLIMYKLKKNDNINVIVISFQNYKFIYNLKYGFIKLLI